MLTISNALIALPALTGLGLSLAGALVIVITVLTLARADGRPSQA
jgi:hypothetical protein